MKLFLNLLTCFGGLNADPSMHAALTRDASAPPCSSLLRQMPQVDARFTNYSGCNFCTGTDPFTRGSAAFLPVFCMGFVASVDSSLQYVHIQPNGQNERAR